MEKRIKSKKQTEGKTENGKAATAAILMVLNFLQSCCTVSDEELDFAHHHKSSVMVLEKFSGTQAMVLSNTSWSSQGHTESMNGLLWTFGRGRRGKRGTL